MTFKLRDYQEQCVEKILWAQSLKGNDLAVLPTAAGKSLIVAEVARRLDKEILILCPSKEIIEQNVSKLRQYVDWSDIGVYSASLGKKQVAKYTFATIGSIYKKPELFDHIGMVICDEAHGINFKNDVGMYKSFLDAIKNPKLVGVTATPYRNVVGYHKVIDNWGNEILEASVTLKIVSRMKPVFWNRIIFNINNAEMLERGYLSPLVYEDAKLLTHEEMKLNKSQSDFDLEDFEQKLGVREAQIVQKVLECEKKYKSVLVFCSSVKQAEKLASIVKNSACVSSKTPPHERDWIISSFKSGAIKTVWNVGVLTTGFDHPGLDCIVMLRPTRSVGLWYQMIGRALRLAPGKTHATIIDYTDTVNKIGRLDTIKLEKDEMNKWELYCGGERWHNRPLYSYSLGEVKKSQPKLVEEKVEAKVEAKVNSFEGLEKYW